MSNLRMVSMYRIVKHLIADRGDFLAALADELELEEMLCGEANPKEFLIQSMENVLKAKQVHYHTRRIEELNTPPKET